MPNITEIINNKVLKFSKKKIQAIMILEILKFLITKC